MEEKKPSSSPLHLYVDLVFWLIVYAALIAVFLWILIVTIILVSKSAIDIGSDASTTTIGFAILATISSLSFSWARNVEKSAKKKNYINFSGKFSFYGALFFALATAIKFAYSNLPSTTIVGKPNSWLYKFTYNTSGYIYIGAFVLAYTFALSAFIFLFIVPFLSDDDPLKEVKELEKEVD